MDEYAVMQNHSHHEIIKELQEIIEMQSKELAKQKKMAHIGELASRLSHDLRNPLSVIQVSVENLILLYGIDNGKQRQIERIKHSIDRITQQVDNVLDYVKERPRAIEKTKTSEIISNSIESVTVPGGIKITISKNNYDVICDKNQLSVAINNLILNAIQAIGNEGIINIKVSKKEQWVIFEIQDSGPGIPNDDLPHIFDPLFTTKQIGTGLGLASVKSIVEFHRGTISVSNSPTIFKVKIPENPI
ncbi:PAS domain-containing sensor histidine kinase [Nitrosopumilus adriaticus]|uniref:sensor histidine kinase n=1 Tax=Nitrosopumilus adriaticus TaxID=1580092 RepID=UPI00352C8D1B